MSAPDERYIGHSGYARDLYGPDAGLRVIGDRLYAALRHVRKHSDEPVQAIAFRGSSGCAGGYLLSYLSGVPPVYVRKLGEDSHGSVVEGPYLLLAGYVIVDDFVCTGKTVKAIQSALDPARCIAVLSYASVTVTNARATRWAPNVLGGRVRLVHCAQPGTWPSTFKREVPKKPPAPAPAIHRTDFAAYCDDGRGNLIALDSPTILP